MAPVNTSADVVVVGGGAVGASVAYHLARAGLHVSLLDRQAAGGRATRAAAGMLAAQEEASDDAGFLRLAVQSRDLFKTLAPEVKLLSGIDPEWAVTGVGRAARDEQEAAALREKAAAQAAQGLPARWLASGEAEAAWPGLAAPFGAYLAPEDGVVNPVLWARALTEAARRRGARVLEFTSAITLLKEGRRVVSARTERGDIRADHVVLAAGAWTPALLEDLDARFPLEPVKGQVLVLAGELGAWTTPVYAGSGYVVPRADGRVLVGATVERVGFDDRPTLDAQKTLAAWIEQWTPSLAARPVVALQAGLRPGSADGKPLIGPVPGWEGVSVACGHHRNGILLSAVTGRLVAEGVAAGRWPAEAAAFSPERFSPAEARPA